MSIAPARGNDVRTWLVVFVFASLLIVLLWPGVRCSSVVVDDVRYWWLADDPMISMRYARNLAAGDGLVWNAGEYVEGYTNLLWTLWMAALHLISPPSTVSALVTATNLVVLVAMLPIITRLVQALGGSTLAAVAFAVAFAFDRGVVYLSLQGFEAPLLALLAGAAALGVLRDSAGVPSVGTALLIGSLTLVRADASVVGGLIYLAWLLLAADRRRVLRLAPLIAAFPVAQEAFRLAYYGEWLPNTAYLKVMSWDGRWRAGLQLLKSFAATYWQVLLLAAFSALWHRTRPTMVLLVLCLVYGAYVASIGGDFIGFRFFVPMMPILFALAACAVPMRQPWPLQVALCAAILWVAPLIHSGPLPGCNDQAVADQIGFLEMALMLRENTAVSSSVGVFRAGIVPYFSERRAVDFLGKADRHVARVEAQANTMKPGHNKFDFAYSLGRLHPNYVVSSFRLPVSPEDMRRASKGDFAFVGKLYFDPLFQQHCLATPTAAKTTRSVFRCDWSRQPEGRWRPLAIWGATVAARFIWHDLPNVVSGDGTEVSVWFQNTGERRWESGSVELRSLSSGPLAGKRIPLTVAVDPGERAEFRFRLAAPRNRGAHSVAWQMAVVGKNLFGERSPTTTVLFQPAT